jgi:hypothetical protein
MVGMMSGLVSRRLRWKGKSTREFAIVRRTVYFPFGYEERICGRGFERLGVLVLFIRSFDYVANVCCKHLLKRLSVE